MSASWFRRGLAAAAGLTLGGTLLIAAPVAPVYATSSSENCSTDSPALVAASPPAFDALGVREAWELATGAGVVVAVVDSGVNVANVHLREGVLPGVNLVVGTDPATTDAEGHGTVAASIIAARGVEGSGLVGVAPESEILPVRVYYASSEEAQEQGVSLTADRIAAGIRWAAENGADVINVSLSTTENIPALEEAVEVATANGALVVASAGNRETSSVSEDVPRYPAAYPGVLGVSAVDVNGAWVAGASFAGGWVDVVTTGQQVPSAFHWAGDCVQAPGDALPSSSWATAYAAGTAALVAQAHPDETPAQWAHRLMVTASRPQPAGRDDQIGWGLVQPVAAIEFIDDGSAPGPPSPIHPAPEPAPAPTSGIDLSPIEDPMAPTRQIALWWLIGGVAFGALVVLIARLGTARRPGRR
ncbi:S8 family serine peptidase [Occultella gossypii]|uniref:S8 family serine peptidase n=1 Tax=Occultella gossypii TaxID=2800820 RepID=A0ABS7SE34_9MICO|nr:S8 family serine peptidase [Occultella gossypii]MBZ2198009.1 S8 family serine peptidase [Occultella gossypii]